MPATECQAVFVLAAEVRAESLEQLEELGSLCVRKFCERLLFHLPQFLWDVCTKLCTGRCQMDRGLASVDTTLLLAGAVPAALIAVAADRGLEWVEQKLSPV